MTQALLHAHITGDPQATPVVLLHAIATHGGMWQAQIAPLADHAHVIAIDLPGHGLSGLLEGQPGIADYADAVVATLDALGIGKAMFVGLSFGSMIAQSLGARHGERVLGLILSNGVHCTPPALAELWQQRVADAQHTGMDAQVPATLARWFTPAFADQHPATIGAIGQMVASTSLEGYCAAASAIAQMDHRDVLGQITASTLVVAGAQDDAAPAQAVMAIANAIAGAQFRLLPGAHLVNIEHGDSYTAMILEFMQGLGAEAARTSEGKSA
ncbi:3-oxoadipate enol-lactonase [Novosphingobium sp. SG751A]|uniref:alpha/beta fold hydrolase n=1 Tax=Novosphingobium sp. SG751A TaxID=2587000 RepID=UPI0015532086|nr:alpha/beta fold hydrolase [Novosphingobium sp. SG751A]NOW48898.1 3-oxoadipate enol-lactonase [Novosphingobium sp. SG751A]